MAGRRLIAKRFTCGAIPSKITRCRSNAWLVVEVGAAHVLVLFLAIFLTMTIRNISHQADCARTMCVTAIYFLRGDKKYIAHPLATLRVFRACDIFLTMTEIYRTQKLVGNISHAAQNWGAIYFLWPFSWKYIVVLRNLLPFSKIYANLRNI